MTARKVALDVDLDGFFEGPEDDPAKWLCVLKLRLDESFDKRSGVCFVAGYLGCERQWKAYVNAWRKELKPRTVIHFADLRLGAEEAPRRHRDLLSRLGSVPSKCGLQAFAGSICKKDYTSKIAGTVLEVLMEGYILAILALMDELVKYLPSNERVQVFFESQVANAELRERAMTMWRKRYRTPSDWSVLAQWGSIPKGTLTEASDYLCYALQQREIDCTSQKADLTAPILEAQWCVRAHHGRDITDKWLADIAASRNKPIPALTAETRRIMRKR
jgi:hypothetical protein